MKLRMSDSPELAFHPSSTSLRLICRPQMPPARFVLFFLASIPNSTSPRNAVPMPDFTTVDASLIWLLDTPVSVLPPFCPAPQRALEAPAPAPEPPDLAGPMAGPPFVPGDPARPPTSCPAEPPPACP